MKCFSLFGRLMKYYAVEGVFRRPRLWSNTELKRIGHHFTGSVISVSAWRDLDKEIQSWPQYFFTKDYDEGKRYRDYFPNAAEYCVTNYPNDNIRGSGDRQIDADEYFDLDLEKPLPDYLKRRFDVVFNHTTLEHVFDVFTAFDNLCIMSGDVVILVVPAIQRVHDYMGNYRDYWRFTPFAVDQLFKRNGYEVLYRSSTNLLQTSVYYFYVASCQPKRWKDVFNPLAADLQEEIGQLNTGEKLFPLARAQLLMEQAIRLVLVRILGFGKDDQTP